MKKYLNKKQLENLTEEQVVENLKIIIKEAILNEDKELLEAILKDNKRPMALHQLLIWFSIQIFTGRLEENI